ncbi:hypothetical protein DYB32_003200 [Aphanomyces invadans]|uniref:DUF2415 domain-containing protein n=1 Tax=Aphanomyces invadans TaxID=157072 RepID=A0A3R6VDI6_9STRA|nr:hypothetical protein DYB32_003200 [Aphanomyces invadans]
MMPLLAHDVLPAPPPRQNRQKSSVYHHHLLQASSVPARTSTISVGGLAYGIHVVGSTAFVACLTHVSWIHLHEKCSLGRVHVSGPARSVVATSNGKSAYVACHTGGLSIIHTTPSLHVGDHFNIPAVGVAMSTSVAVVVCDLMGVCFFDTRSHTWTSMLPLAVGGTTFRAKAVQVLHDRYAYIACDAGMVVVVDFIDARHPVILTAKRLFSGDAHAIALTSSAAYIACGARGVAVIDLEQLKAMGVVKTAYGSVFDVHLDQSSRRLLCACQVGGLAVYDISDDDGMSLTFVGQTNAFDGICHGVGSTKDKIRSREVGVVTCQSGGVQVVVLDAVETWPEPKRARLADACTLM